MLGQLGPAVNRNFAVFSIQADDDMSGKFEAQVIDKVRRADRFGANDQIIDTSIQVGLDDFRRAYATPQLNRQIRMISSNLFME